MNIVRKVIPDAFEGIVRSPFIPVVLGLWTKITNVVVQAYPLLGRFVWISMSGTQLRQECQWLKSTHENTV